MAAFLSNPAFLTRAGFLLLIADSPTLNDCRQNIGDMAQNVQMHSILPAQSSFVQRNGCSLYRYPQVNWGISINFITA